MPINVESDLQVCYCLLWIMILSDRLKSNLGWQVITLVTCPALSPEQWLELLCTRYISGSLTQGAMPLQRETLSHCFQFSANSTPSVTGHWYQEEGLDPAQLMSRHHYYVSFLDFNIAIDKKKTWKDTVEMVFSHYCKSGYANKTSLPISISPPFMDTTSQRDECHTFRNRCWN